MHGYALVLLLALLPVFHCTDQGMEALREEVGTLRSELKTMQARQTEGSDLESRVADLEDDLESRVADLELEMDTVQEDVHQLQQNVSDLNLHVTTLYNSDGYIYNRLIVLEQHVLVDWLFCTLHDACVNGATCVDVNVDTYICMCRDGFFGRNCENSYADTAFLAALDEPLFPGGNVIFPRDDINPGGHYDPTTGAYTAPYNGTYQFTVHVQGTRPYFNVLVDAVAVYVDLETQESYRSATFLLDLTAGQGVTLQSHNDMEGDLHYLVTYFTGHLVYPH